MNSPANTNPNLTTKKHASICKHILLGKLSYAEITILFVQLIVLLSYINLTHFTITDPFGCVVQTFIIFKYFSTWFFILVMHAILFALSILVAKDYVSEQPTMNTRYRKLINILSLQNILLLVAHVTFGYFTIWCYLSIARGNYSDLIVECNEHTSYCIDEHHLNLIILGVVMSLDYFMRIYKRNKRVLFPPIQQPKRVVFNTEIWSVFVSSFQETSRFLIPFNIGYELVGYIFKSTVIAGMKMQPKQFTLQLLLQQFLLAGLVNFMLRAVTFIHELFLTEAVDFPIQSDDLALHDAVKTNVPIVQHLAALDFLHVAQSSPAKRVQLFALSQPGEHPHNWNNLVSATFGVIRSYTEVLNRSLTQQRANIATVVATSTPKNYVRLRSMRMPIVEYDSVSPVKINEDKSKDLVEALKAKAKSVLGINYWFEELPECAIEKCLENSQVMVWLCEALSTMLVRALNEDRYGVAQNDIQGVITHLVELKQAVERLPSYNTRKSSDDFNAKMRQALYAAVKRSIFRIAVNMQPYINRISLRRDVLAQVLEIANYKI